MRSKTRWLFPSEKKPARFRASLFSPAERNHARSALKRFFHAQALAERKKGKLGVSMKLLAGAIVIDNRLFLYENIKTKMSVYRKMFFEVIKDVNFYP